jgi:hypothetical protein
VDEHQKLDLLAKDVKKRVDKLAVAIKKLKAKQAKQTRRGSRTR